MTSSTLTRESGSRKVEAIAQRHPWLVTVARLGWVAKGVVYMLVGVLAVPIAIDGLRGERGGGGQDEASQTGAVAKIAETSFGSLALWIIAIGLALYVVWRLISILLPAENSATVWLTRVGYLVSAVVYSALAWSALSFARRERSAAAPRARTPRSATVKGLWTSRSCGGLRYVRVLGARRVGPPFVAGRAGVEDVSG